MQPIYKKPRRSPGLADRSAIPDDELSDYDKAYELMEQYSAENEWSSGRPRVDGEPYAFSYRVAWTNAPALFTAFNEAASATTYRAGTPGWYLPADHELAELTLGFDSGYWAFHAGHTANAIVAGVRIEAMRALRQGRESALSPDEALVIGFTRAVRDGQMTDELWERMLSRLGTVRGTIALAYQVCISNSILQMMSVFGVPALPPEEWDALLDAYETGALDASKDAHSYVNHTLQNLQRSD